MKRGRPWRRGAESVEVAVALPLVILVIFTGFEYGWLVLRSMQLDHVARIGARHAVLSNATAQSVQDRVQTALSEIGIADATVTITPTEPADAEPGTPVAIEVQVPYASVRLLGLGRLMPLPSSLAGRASMVREPDA